MPRRAEFIFYQIVADLQSCGTPAFQCPEGLNSFSITDRRRWRPLEAPQFQCPEGLNSFSILANAYVELFGDELVSMPRRAEFIFYQYPAADRTMVKVFVFQCPEGLNSFSIGHPARWEQ